MVGSEVFASDVMGGYSTEGPGLVNGEKEDRLTSGWTSTLGDSTVAGE